MIRKDYFPREESAQLTWSDNLVVQAAVTANQTAMEWTPAEGANVVNAATVIETAVLAKEAARAVYLAAVAAADAQIAAALAVIRALVAAGKENPLYTIAIGQLLRIIGAEVEFDPLTYQADLREAKAMGNATVRFKFSVAYGELDAARLFARRSGQTLWTVAATMMRSPYLHQMVLTTPGVPETWEFRIRGIVGNEEIGEYSDVTIVTVT